MPNNCINELIFRDAEKATQERIIAATCDAEGQVDFQILVPIPLNIWRGNVSSEHERAFKRTGLDWARENWGTKWNAYSHHPIERTDNTVALRFETAWGPPYPWLAAVFNHLGLPFQHNWLSEGGGDGVVGTFKVAALCSKRTMLRALALGVVASVTVCGAGEARALAGLDHTFHPSPIRRVEQLYASSIPSAAFKDISFTVSDKVYPAMLTLNIFEFDAPGDIQPFFPIPNRINLCAGRPVFASQQVHRGSRADRAELTVFDFGIGDGEKRTVAALDLENEIVSVPFGRCGAMVRQLDGDEDFISFGGKRVFHIDQREIGSKLGVTQTFCLFGSLFGCLGSTPSLISSFAGIDGGPNSGRQGEKSAKCLQPPCPQLLAGDVRLRLRGVGGPSLLYKIICILAIFLGFLLTGIGLAQAFPPSPTGRELRGIAILAAGAVLSVSGIGFAVIG